MARLARECLLLPLLVVAVCSPAALAELSIKNFGYQGVVVSISPDVPEAKATQIIDGIKVGRKKMFETEERHPNNETSKF